MRLEYYGAVLHVIKNYFVRHIEKVDWLLQSLRPFKFCGAISAEYCGTVKTVILIFVRKSEIINVAVAQNL